MGFVVDITNDLMVDNYLWFMVDIMVYKPPNITIITGGLITFCMK